MRKAEMAQRDSVEQICLIKAKSPSEWVEERKLENR
jgi:hypothetical protein